MAVDIVKPEDAAKVETLVMVKRRRVMEHGSDVAETKKPGDKIKIKGLDKIQLLSSGDATRNLDYKPEPKEKRIVPVNKSQVAQLVDSVNKLVEVVEKLIAKK
jgi:hypothetical protein